MATDEVDVCSAMTIMGMWNVTPSWNIKNK